MTAPTSIALAPFENLSGDPAQDPLTRGFVEDVATALSRFGTVEVIYPRAMLAALAEGHTFDAAAATHTLRGSIRRVGNVVRIAAQLLDARVGCQVWADRYDATASSLLAIQDQIAEQIASALAIRVDQVRLAAAQRRPLASLDTYECWLRGFDCLQRGTVEGDADARACFQRALDSDPAYARAYAGMSLSHFNAWSCQAWEKWDERERLAFDNAHRAAQIDDSDAIVQVVLARILLYRRRFDEATYHVDRALALNPNNTDVLGQASLCRSHLGDGEKALELAARAMRLNPAHPPWYWAAEAAALFVLGRDAELMALGSRVPLTMFVDLPAFLAAACALAGDLDRARAYLSRFRSEFAERITFGRVPEPAEPLRWLLHVNPFQREEDGERLERGLRAAGLEADPDENRPEATLHAIGRQHSDATFRQEGDFWTLAFGGLAVQLTHQKGFSDLARMLERPGAEIHCLELADRPAETGGREPVMDDRARREIQARARELQREIDDADAAHDAGRAERAREELDRIVETLSGAFGLGGRSRALGSMAERARSAVTWRIRSAIKKISKAHPRLGRHLDNAVRTGTFCVYEPETPIRWTV